MYVCMYLQIDRQIDRLDQIRLDQIRSDQIRSDKIDKIDKIDRQVGRQIDRQIDKIDKIDRQVGRQIDRQTDEQTDKQIQYDTNRYMDDIWDDHGWGIWSDNDSTANAREI